MPFSLALPIIFFASIVQCRVVAATSIVTLNEITNNTNKPIAVLHVGPRKTGTSSVQDTIRNHRSVLLNEEPTPYNILQAKSYSHRTGKNPGWVFSFCNTYNTTRIYEERCLPQYDYYMEILDYIAQFSASKHNFLLSREQLDFAEEMDLHKLQHETLKHFNIQIIMGYRRFYDWLVSWYHESHRVDDHGMDAYHNGIEWPNTANEGGYVDNLLYFIATPAKLEKLYTKHYCAAVFRRYHEYFPVSIMNLHDEEDLMTGFFCQHIPNATKTCATIRIRDADKTKIVVNSGKIGHDTEYDELAVAAYLANAFKKNINATAMWTRPQIRDLVQQRQESALGLSTHDFPKKCISSELSDRILEMSLQAEKEIVPEFYQSSEGAVVLRRQLQYAAKTTLCSVDTEKVLAKPGWSDFFRSL